MVDKETAEMEREGQMIEDFSKSDGWRWIKDRFTEEIMDLQSIRNIDPQLSPEGVVLDIKARHTAVDILLKMIQKVEGRASQHANNKQVIRIDEEIIYFEKEN